MFKVIAVSVERYDLKAIVIVPSPRRILVSLTTTPAHPEFVLPVAVSADRRGRSGSWSGRRCSSGGGDLGGAVCRRGGCSRGEVGRALHLWSLCPPQDAHAGGFLLDLLCLLLTLYLLLEEQLKVLLKSIKKNTSLKHIHPFIQFLPLIQFRIAAGLEPIPTVIGQEATYTLYRSPICPTQPHIHTYGQSRKEAHLYL